MAEEKFAEQKLTDEELDGVAGGTREEFNEICGLLGKSPTWNTRDGIRKLLKKQYGITVEHWNTGDRGSKKNAPAEFYVTDPSVGLEMQIRFDHVKGIIKGELTIRQVCEMHDGVC